MKKIATIILFIGTSAFFVSGQVNYNDSRDDLLAAMQRTRNFRAHIAAENITSVQTFGYSHDNSKGYLMTEVRYDNRGNNTDWFLYKNGKVKGHWQTDYDDSNRIIQFTIYNGTGKLRSMNKTTYDNSGNLIDQDLYKKNSQKLYSKTMKTYDSRNNMTESKKFDNKGNLKNRVVYSYYDDGSKKQTIQYSGTGKVKRVWNFDCNPVGKLEAAKFKDTSKVCVHYETDKDGNPIKVKEEYTGAGMFGRTIRSVSKYDKNNNMIDAASYTLNGKQLSHSSASFNTSGRITEYIMYKGGTRKTLFRTTYTYNNDGNIAESVIYRNSQTPVSTMKYVYTSSISSPAK